MERKVATPARWAVNVRWGAQRLTTEVLDAERPQVRLGSDKACDVVTGHTSNIVIRLDGDGVRVTFSGDVTGAYRQRGDWPMALQDTVARGLAKQAPGGFELAIAPSDELQLNAGTVAVEVSPIRGVLERLPFDPRWLWLLALALLGVGVVLGSVVFSEPVSPARFVRPPAPRPLRAP